ncbi:MAG: hypothetical protein LBP59_12230 [Planctomycetaceae bacterium]|jgi:uncharacterized membrane protein YeaQ/YmgE (transglycosylase-associated protein family)|nr:hypothetical protein [Planctomycetaceae bacterium]
MIDLLNFSPAIQLWFNTILIWIGFGVLAGIMAQALLPSGKPAGLYGILVIGICGSCAGVFLVDTVTGYIKIDEFSGINPIGPVGLVVSVLTSLIILICYRLVLSIINYCTKKKTN